MASKLIIDRLAINQWSLLLNDSDYTDVPLWAKHALKIARKVIVKDLGGNMIGYMTM